MENYFWPGAYSFKSDLKVLLEEMKKQIEFVLVKISELDNKCV